MNKKTSKAKDILQLLLALGGGLVALLGLAIMPYWGLYGASLSLQEQLFPPPTIDPRLMSRYVIAAIGIGAILSVARFPWYPDYNKKTILKSLLMWICIAPLVFSLMLLSHQVGFNIFVPGVMLIALLVFVQFLFKSKSGVPKQGRTHN